MKAAHGLILHWPALRAVLTLLLLDSEARKLVTPQP